MNDLGFSVGDGEIFGFLGPDGAGKCTTQKVLIGLSSHCSLRISRTPLDELGGPKPQRGPVFVDGHLADWSKANCPQR